MRSSSFAAIVFTDVVSSTEMVARLGAERAEQARHAHFCVLRRAIAAHRGSEVKNLGDGLMVSFATPSDALGCAVAMQQQVVLAAQGSGSPIAMRVGVNRPGSPGGS